MTPDALITLDQAGADANTLKRMQQVQAVYEWQRLVELEYRRSKYAYWNRRLPGPDFQLAIEAIDAELGAA